MQVVGSSNLFAATASCVKAPLIGESYANLECQVIAGKALSSLPVRRSSCLQNMK
jgi:hypothetical protein